MTTAAQTSIINMTASELLQAYSTKALSPVEVMQAVISQIESQEPVLQATYLFAPETALEKARESERLWHQGSPRGPLEGVPVTIKENIATAGDPLPLGTKAVVPQIAQIDAPPAARLREAGALMVSKTTMPDFGMLSSGKSSFHRTARNPWDMTKTPGGSSAGAGSAAAAGYGPLHLGTDIGGSVRIPAGWCGLFGLKPSLGRIPIDPPYMGRVAGPMTRSVSDGALMMQILCLPDERDSMSLPYQSLAWLQQMDQPEILIEQLKGKRIGLLQSAGCGMPVDPKVTECIAKAAAVLQNAGVRIEPMTPFMNEDLLQHLNAFWQMRSYVELQSLPQSQREKVLPFIGQWAQIAANFSAQRTYAAANGIYATRVATVKACQPYDYVISPVTPGLAFEAENASPRNMPNNALEHIGFTVPFNMSEQPAATINCGYVQNDNACWMPVGLHIAGKRFDDLGVLRVARAFEALRCAQRPWPQQH